MAFTFTVLISLSTIEWLFGNGSLLSDFVNHFRIHSGYMAAIALTDRFVNVSIFSVSIL